MAFSENWYGDEQCAKVAELAKSCIDIDGYFIEVGTWAGKSASNIARAIYPATLLCVDTWRGNEDESIVTGIEHPSATFAKERDIYQEFIDNMAEQDITNFSPYRVKWQDFFDILYPFNDLAPGTDNQLGDKGIAFIHIDASHDYDSVKDCIERVKPFMLTGGIMCGDDYLTADDTRSDLNGGVMRAVKELLPAHTNDNNLWYVRI
jgi:hypothetical protein